MEKMVVSTFVSKGTLRLYLDCEVIANNSDTSTVEVSENGTYVIQWFVKGQPGSSYAITISSPRYARLQFTRSIGKSGKDFGGFQFDS